MKLQCVCFLCSHRSVNLAFFISTSPLLPACVKKRQYFSCWATCRQLLSLLLVSATSANNRENRRVEERERETGKKSRFYLLHMRYLTQKSFSYFAFFISCVSCYCHAPFAHEQNGRPCVPRPPSNSPLSCLNTSSLVFLFLEGGGERGELHDMEYSAEHANKKGEIFLVEQGTLQQSTVRPSLHPPPHTIKHC